MQMSTQVIDIKAEGSSGSREDGLLSQKRLETQALVGNARERLDRKFKANFTSWLNLHSHTAAEVRPKRSRIRPLQVPSLGNCKGGIVSG